MFVSILYMFRAAMCPSSGELIVSIRHLVYVTVYRWCAGLDETASHPNLQTKRSSTCFGQPCAHHQENWLYQYDIWYMSLCIDGVQVCMRLRLIQTCTPEWHISDVALIQLILLMMGTWLPETC